MLASLDISYYSLENTLSLSLSVCVCVFLLPVYISPPLISISSSSSLDFTCVGAAEVLVVGGKMGHSATVPSLDDDANTPPRPMSLKATEVATSP